MSMDARTPLLYLVHRIPYPPNKGDKVRSFNILRELARRHRVFLGCFVDQPEDMACVESLHAWCEEVCALPLDPRRGRLASLVGLATGEALSLPYYRSRQLRAWVQRTVAKHAIRQAVAFSGPMAQYLDVPGIERRVVDFCDVDSAKWSEYAETRPWPLSWLYRREGRRLLAFERAAALSADAATFVTEAEADLFRRAAPEAAPRVHALPNGVDTGYFSPEAGYPNPYPQGGPVIVFTGAMDYWPNIDAVSAFVREVLPRILAAEPTARFYIVGMNPAPAVQALAGAQVVVTGRVEDIRPWLAHAEVVVAPLRIARGIQNKVLEAMAMGKAVVVSAAAAVGLAGRAGRDFAVAEGADSFAAQVADLLADAGRRASLGQEARACVLTHYAWAAHLSALERLLARPSPAPSPTQAREAHA